MNQKKSYMITVPNTNYKFFLHRYEVKFQVPMECGGAYLKLISKSDNLELVSL